MKRQKRRNALRKRLEKLGIIAMILVSSGLMFQLIINVLIMNSNNLVTAYSRELNETNYIEIETKTEEETEKETENEVESQVQSEEYLTIDIEVEKETKSTELSKEYEVDKDDLDLLSHLIMAEEEGASYENKLMCGLVAMNRVKDKSYPNTLEEVIFQKDKKGNVQYACIKSAKGKKARIYLEPNEDSLRAAKEILSKNCSIKIPEEVVFQSERPLGSGVYKKIGNQYYSYK
jgi:cell wall hydrolase